MFRPLIPPPKKSPEREAADRERAEIARLWGVPHKPKGTLVFDVPKKLPVEMTRTELGYAWNNVSRHRELPEG